MGELTLRERISGVLLEDLAARCAQEASHGGTGDVPALTAEADRQTEALISRIGWAAPEEEDELRARLATLLDPFVVDVPAGAAAAHAVMEILKREVWESALRLTVGYELAHRQDQTKLMDADDRIEDLERKVADLEGEKQ